MTLQSSGAISIANLASEYGGSAPHSLNEYYKGGSLVPSTVAETVTAASMSGSVYDGRGGIYTTYPAINSGGYIYRSYTWADNGYTGTGNISWTVNKTGTYHYQGTYYIQNATRTATHTWYVAGSQVATYTLTAGNNTASTTGSFSVTAGQTVNVQVSWPSAGWASCGLYFGGSAYNNNSVQTAANGNVPTSGAVSLTDFYGGRKT
jgi:hypothetical protein